MKYDSTYFFLSGASCCVSTTKLIADISLAKRLIDFKPKTSFNESLDLTIEYYKSIQNKEKLEILKVVDY